MICVVHFACLEITVDTITGYEIRLAGVSIVVVVLRTSTQIPRTICSFFLQQKIVSSFNNYGGREQIPKTSEHITEVCECVSACRLETSDDVKSSKHLLC